LTKQLSKEFLARDKSDNSVTSERSVESSAEKRILEQAVIKAQRDFHAGKAYKRLNEGWEWHGSALIGKQNLNLQKFKEHSLKNVRRLQSELGELTADEKKFYGTLLKQDYQLCHYTNAFNAIRKSHTILSSKQLHDKKVYYKDSSGSDILPLKNDDFVFFRMEIEHDPHFKSRFGNEQLIFNDEDTQFHQQGWVSLYDMLKPQSASNARQLKYIDSSGNEKIARYCDSPFANYTNGKLTYYYNSDKKTADFDVIGTTFYGPDIRRGIALAAIRELRLIGGEYQSTCLAGLETSRLEDTLSNLFRLEAKIASIVDIAHVPVQYTSPIDMTEAIESNNTVRIAALLEKGMNVNATVNRDVSAIFHACKSKSTFESMEFLHKNGAELVNNQGESICHITAIHGNTDAVIYGLGNGIDLHAVNKESKSILSYALMHRHSILAIELLNRGLKITKDDLFSVIKCGHLDLVKLIFEKNPELFLTKDAENNTVLHISAATQFAGIYQFLSTHFLQLMSVENNQGQSMLHVMFSSNNTDADIIASVGIHSPLYALIHASDVNFQNATIKYAQLHRNMIYLCLLFRALNQHTDHR
jgi:ankyrin repeat protein